MHQEERDSGSSRHTGSTLGAAVGAVLLVIGLFLGWLFSYSRELRIENVAVPSGNGESIRARLLTPRECREAVPGVIVCHGMMACKEMMDAFSMEVARNGYVVIVPDFPTEDNEKNTLLIRGLVSYLAAFPAVNKDTVGLVGHSLGALEVVDAAYHEESVKATVAFGLYIGGELSLDMKNLLLATGFYDDIFPPLERTASIRSVTDGSLDRAGVLWGAFSAGNARKLVISPFSQHSSEVVDPFIISHSIKWLNNGLGSDKKVKRIIFSQGLSGIFLCHLGCLLLLLFIPMVLAQRWGNYRPGRIFLCLVNVLAGVLSITGVIDGATGLVILGESIFSIIMTDYLLIGSSSPCAAGRRLIVLIRDILMFLILFSISLCISIAVFETGIRGGDERVIAVVPAYLFISFFEYPLFALYSVLRNLIDTALLPLTVVLLLQIPVMILEVQRPGKIGGMFARMWNFCTRFNSGKGKSKTSSLLVLLVAVLFALAVIIWVLQAGGLNLHIIKGALRDMVKYFLAPLAASIIFYRLIHRKMAPLRQ